MRTPKYLRAVHDDDLETFLKELGILRDIMEGKVRCSTCAGIVKLANLGAVYPVSGSVKALCDSPACIRKFVRMQNEENNA